MVTLQSLGIVRKTDTLGRIVIPRELRRTLDINQGTPIEIFVEEDLIILRKFKSSKACMITGEILSDNVEYPGGIILSPNGAKQLLEILKNSNHDN